MIQYPDHAMKRRVVPDFYPNPIMSMLKIHLSGHIPLFPTKHTTNIALSYSIGGKHLILDSEQVDEYLSQLILALPWRARISGHSQA